MDFVQYALMQRVRKWRVDKVAGDGTLNFTITALDHRLGIYSNRTFVFTILEDLVY